MMVSFIKRGGCWTGFNLRDMTIDNVLFALNRTNEFDVRSKLDGQVSLAAVSQILCRA